MARRLPATLVDVATRAGCSIATVSRLVTGAAQVAPAARDAIERAIRELGYVGRRQRAAASDARLVEVVLYRRSDLEHIALAGADLRVGERVGGDESSVLGERWHLSNDFHRLMLDGIVAELSTHGRKAVLDVADRFDAVSSQGGDALLVVGEDGAAVDAFAHGCGRPLVLVDIVSNAPAQEQVTSDNAVGIGMALEHLARLGHREVGHVGAGDSFAGRERAQAFAW
ncbi:MAG: LacI family DNA-binding transcriptional regulator, partial [Planctomycetes bacterium]|nr:LacI family DNA-binding transcriptional regulator [Planctomycetota bacterium]